MIKREYISLILLVLSLFVFTLWIGEKGKVESLQKKILTIRKRVEEMKILSEDIKSRKNQNLSLSTIEDIARRNSISLDSVRPLDEGIYEISAKYVSSKNLIGFIQDAHKEKIKVIEMKIRKNFSNENLNDVEFKVSY